MQHGEGPINSGQNPSVMSATTRELPGARRVCIIILGMHRSGTSALTRMISLLGAALPKKILGANASNITGHWEPERLVMLHDRMLVEAGSHWDDWRTLDLAALAPSRANYYRAEISRILEEEYGDAPLIVLKEPRICRFVPLYIEILEGLGYELKFIHIMRNPLAVSASLEKRDRISPSLANVFWLRHVLDAEAATRGYCRVFVSYEALLNGWRSIINMIDAKFAVDWPRREDAMGLIGAFLDSEQSQQGRSAQKLQSDGNISYWLNDTYEALMALESDAGNADALAKLELLRTDFNNAALHMGESILSEMMARMIGLNAAVEQSNELRAQLAEARSRPASVLRDLLAFRILTYLSTKAPPLSARTAARFAKSARKRDPERSIGGTQTSSKPSSAVPVILSPTVANSPSKKSVLVVSHDASRTGAPILALNLVQQLSTRYDVVSLVLGGGELVNDFNLASVAMYSAKRKRKLARIIKKIITKHRPLFAIINSVESRMVLRPLQAAAVPTVTLIHEFANYIRPRSNFSEVLSLSTKTVFSTRLTLESAMSECSFYPGTSIQVVPQGKCAIPANSEKNAQLSAERAWLMQNLRPEGDRSRPFLVIGAGSINLRKGVDQFIECATFIINSPSGQNFRFAWIGDGYDPENELSYSVYLADQIRRAGIESQIKMLRSTSEIELAYNAADFLLVSSRLDPLPNVAIDAMLAGLPVLCFDRTTGIADFLIENGFGEHCVAKYLDSRDLAEKVMALADSEELRSKISTRLQATAVSAFDMKNYALRIEEIAIQAVHNASQVKEDVKAILASQRFRSDFYMHAGVASRSDKEIVEDYVHRTASGIGLRKPMPGFHPTVYAWLQTLEGKPKGDPFADFLRRGRPDGPWSQKVIQNDTESKMALQSGLRVALHLHVFYPDQMGDLLERLSLNTAIPDLFISVASDEAAAQIRKALSVYRGRIVDLRITPNLGRNLGPLLTQFGRTLCCSYDIIGHVHTKKSIHIENRSVAEAWKTFLLENLVGGRKGGAMLDSIIAAVTSDPTIGIVFPDDPNVMSWTQNQKYANKLSRSMNLGDLPEHFNFPIGSMFWIRSSVLSKFVALDLTWDDYPAEPLPIDGTILHAIERLFGVVPMMQGMSCAVTNVWGATR
jgi:glycosyltransferase involved in cell wall biosynthesis